MKQTTRGSGLVLACLAAWPALAWAQHRGTIELGAFGRYGTYDENVRVNNATGFGGRLGWFLSRKVVLEADAALAPTTSTWAPGNDVDHVPVHLRLLGNFPLGKRMAFLFGGGWTINNFIVKPGITTGGGNSSENGVGALAGLRLSLGKSVSIRAEAQADYMFENTASYGFDERLHYTAQLGVSLMIRSGPGDKDKSRARTSGAVR